MPDRLDITAVELQENADRGSDIAFALLAGRVVGSIRSLRTGEHITVQIACRAKRGDRWERVPFTEATHLFLDVPGADGRWPDKVGTYYPAGKHAGLFWTDRAADPARVWAARFLLDSAAGRPVRDDQAEIFLSDHCLLCGRELTHPESVQRHMGPDCAQVALRGEHERKQRLSCAPSPPLPGDPAPAKGPGRGRPAEAGSGPEDARERLLAEARASVDRAVRAGNSLELILDGIAEDEKLEGIKSDVEAYARLVSDRAAGAPSGQTGLFHLRPGGRISDLLEHR